MFEQYPVVDEGTFNCFGFDVLFDEGSKVYQLIATFAECDFSEGDVLDTSRGLNFVTAIKGKSLTEMAWHVNKIIDTGMFNHLIFVSGSHAVNLEEDLIYTFDWNDYFNGSSIAIH